MTQKHSTNSNILNNSEEHNTVESNNEDLAVAAEDSQDTKTQSETALQTDFTQDEVLEMVSQIESLTQENAKLKDESLRAKAEMENSKKRITKHYEELSREKVKQLLLDVVVLLDDFERAFEAGQNSDSEAQKQNIEASMLDGIKLIETQFMQTLQNKWQLERFDSVDEVFDPQKHEALMSEVRDDLSMSIVVEEFSKGYMYGERILRPAKVKVAMPPA